MSNNPENSLSLSLLISVGINIQSETHDSIEDAYTALRLYKKYLDLRSQTEEEKDWESQLKKMYEEGRRLKWKVPGTE